MRPKEKPKPKPKPKKRKRRKRTKPHRLLQMPLLQLQHAKQAVRQASRRNDVKSEAKANLVLGARRQREEGRSHHDADA
jgi:hypothetical protein